MPTASDVRVKAGRGLVARVGERDYALGSMRLVDEQGATVPPALDARAKALLTEGRTVSWLVELGEPPRVLAVLAFGDELKDDAQRAIDRLHEAGVRTALVSGDNAAAAEAVGRRIGIDDVRADVLPEQKSAVIESLKGHPLFAHITLSRSERSPIAALVTEMLEEFSPGAPLP